MKNEVKNSKAVTKAEILEHLKKYDKIEFIDRGWVDELIFVLDELQQSRTDVQEYGRITVSKNGYTTRSGYLQSHETLLKMYNAISAKLGVSPVDREKWIVKVRINKSHLIK